MYRCPRGARDLDLVPETTTRKPKDLEKQFWIDNIAFARDVFQKSSKVEPPALRLEKQAWI
jgi:hypothetical protein